MPRYELCIKLASPTEMRRLNLRYRGKDKAADVLAFPLLTPRELSTPSRKSDILHLGDIVINRDDAKKNFLFLAVHGFLHLLGFDHERSVRDEKIMFSLQDEILNYLRN